MTIGLIILIILAFFIWYYVMVIKPRKNTVDFSNQLVSIGYTLENSSNSLAFKKAGNKKYVIKSAEHFVSAMQHKKRFYLFEVKTPFSCEEFALLKKPAFSTPSSRDQERLFVNFYFNTNLTQNDSLGEFRVLYNKKSKFWKIISDFLEISYTDIVYLSKKGFSKILINYSPRKPRIDWVIQAEKEFERVNSLLRNKK